MRSRLMLTAACLLMTLAAFSVPALAVDESDFRVGLQAGDVGLLSDLGARSGNALGAGVAVGYAAADDMIFELGYLGSAHSGLRHSEFNLGLDYYVGSNGALYPFVSGGAVFSGNSIDDLGSTLNSSAFGIYAGGGVDFELGSRFMTTLFARYNKIFETKVTRNDGTQMGGVQDNFVVMVRLSYVFNEKNASSEKP